MQQAVLYIVTPGDKNELKDRFKEEIEEYITSSYQAEMEDSLVDVYITNHEPKVRKYHTNNSKEDEQFYKYLKSVKEYN